MAGSGWFHRTEDPKPGFEEKKEGQMAQLAISYKKIGGGEGTAKVASDPKDPRDSKESTKDEKKIGKFI